VSGTTVEPELHRPQIECLLSIVQDPTQADTLLASALV